jgi:hypothetical protein
MANPENNMHQTRNEDWMSGKSGHSSEDDVREQIDLLQPQGKDMHKVEEEKGEWHTVKSAKKANPGDAQKFAGDGQMSSLAKQWIPKNDPFKKSLNEPQPRPKPVKFDEKGIVLGDRYVGLAS